MKKLLIVLVAIGLLSGSALAADPRCAAGMARGVTKYCGGAGDKVTSDARLGLNKALAFVVIGENAMKAGEYSKASFNFISALNLGLDTYTRDRLLQGFVALSNYYYSQGMYWESVNTSIYVIDTQESHYAGYRLTARGYHALGDDTKAAYYLQFVRLFAKGAAKAAIEREVANW